MSRPYFFANALVIKGFIIIKIKMSPKIPLWYVMDIWSMRKQKLIDQLSWKISEIIRKKKNDRLAAILNFISAKFVMGYPCVRPYTLFHFMVQLVCIFLRYVNITKLRQTTILKLFAPKS